MTEYDLKYMISVKADEEDEAIEIVNTIMREAFKTHEEITDWDGPL